MEPKLPPINDAERTPLVTELLAIIEAERKRRQKLEGEKEKLEGEKKRLEAELDRFRKRLSQYEPEVWYEGKRPSSDSGVPSASYSMNAEEKRRAGRRRKKKSPGRQHTEVKFAIAERTEPVYPEGFSVADCRLVRERAVWRLEDGKAVLIGYRIFAGPDGKEPRIPGVTPRCEYGIEILVVLAFLKYVIGLSLDKTRAVLGFFCGLSLSKSEADALLRQLANYWESEYDTLCELIAHAAVVYMDETGWKVGDENCSLWLFASQLHLVFLFGCRKDAATLDKMLPPDVFDGIGVSDDASVYCERFKQAQKCWAHLLRKAIRLALMYPRKRRYQRFLDELLALYRDAKSAAADGRLAEAGRKQRVLELEDRLAALCRRYDQQITSDMKPHEHEFANLVNELARLLMAEELFTFVLVNAVDPTNNLPERKLRNSASDRKTGRINQTAAGAHRRSVIVSVMESLRANLAQFTLKTVLDEVSHWMREGMSLFAKQWKKIQEAQPIPEPATG